MTKRSWCGVLALMALHAGLAFHTAILKSPVWDEIVYPAAGFDLLATGRVRVSLDHPPLGKVLIALPLEVFRSQLVHPLAEAGKTDSFRYGFQFVYQNTLSPLCITLQSRWMSMVLSLGLGVLLFVFVRRRWGEASAFLTLTVYSFSPAVIARASLALLDMPLVFFLTAAWMAFLFWLEKPSPRRFGLWVLLWACALLVKTTALVLAPSLLLALFASSSRERKKAWVLTGGVVLGGVLAVLISEAVMRLLGSSYIATQWMGRDASYFLHKLPVYFHGVTYETARWYFGLAAWGIKTPLPVLILAACGAWIGLKQNSNDSALALCLGLSLTAGLLLLSVRSIIATTHYFFLYPVMAVLAAPLLSALRVSRPGSEPKVRQISGKWLGFSSDPSRWTTFGVYGAGFWLMLATSWNHPDHLAYCNELIGGTQKGSAWLSDSDQDWGQDLGTLSRWMRRKGLPAVLLGYCGPGDPRAYGIRYQDVLSPALVTAVYRGEVIRDWSKGLYLVVSAKVLQSEPGWMGWLSSHRRPVERLGGTLAIYELTHDPEARAWLSAIYEKTHRPSLAASVREATMVHD